MYGGECSEASINCIERKLLSRNRAPSSSLIRTLCDVLFVYPGQSYHVAVCASFPPSPLPVGSKHIIQTLPPSTSITTTIRSPAFVYEDVPQRMRHFEETWNIKRFIFYGITFMAKFMALPREWGVAGTIGMGLHWNNHRNWVDAESISWEIQDQHSIPVKLGYSQLDIDWGNRWVYTLIVNAKHPTITHSRDTSGYIRDRMFVDGFMAVKPIPYVKLAD